jgi:hypothetical protein
MSTEPKVYLSWDASFQKVKAYVDQYKKFPFTFTIDFALLIPLGETLLD